MEKLYGFQAVDITSAGFLPNPEILFRLSNCLNQFLPEHRQVGIELYAAVDDPLAERFNRLVASRGFRIPIPIGVTYDRVMEWQTKYPLAKVVRVHDDFSYNNLEQWWRFLKSSRHLNPGRFLPSLAMTYFFTPANRRRAFHLAEELEVGMNLHGNIALGLIRDGQLEQVRSRLPFLWVENGLGDDSILTRGVNGLASPEEIIKNFVEPYQLGLMLAADHLMDLGKDPTEALTSSRVRQFMEGVHAAKANHGLIEVGNPTYENFFRTLAVVPHDRQVRIVYDNNPFQLQRYSFDQLVEKYRESINWIWRLNEVF